MNPLGQQALRIPAKLQAPLVLSTINRRVPMARTLYEGDTIPVVVPVVDSEGKPVDLSNCVVMLRIAQQPGVPAQIEKKMAVTDAANGIAECLLLPTDTTGIRGTQYYEVTVRRPGTTEEVVAAGSLTFYDTVRQKGG